jgi:ERF superfamily protein
MLHLKQPTDDTSVADVEALLPPTTLEMDVQCAEASFARQDVAVVEETPAALVRADISPERAALFELAVSKELDVAKLDALINMQDRMEDRQAERTFNQAMTRLAGKMPRVQKNGMIEFEDKKGNLQKRAHARYEDIDEAIRPHLIDEGMSITFTSKYGPDGLTVFGTLAHMDGHSRTAEMRLPVDSSGAKNPLQGMGSSLSYGKRYLVCMLLNIITVGEDDDAKRAGMVFLTEEQIARLQTGIDATGTDPRELLSMVSDEIHTFNEIQQKDFPKLLNALISRKREQDAKKS